MILCPLGFRHSWSPFAESHCNDTALGMPGHQPGPVSLFSSRPGRLGCPVSLFCFGWHQAWGLDLFFDHGCDFIFCGFRAKGKRSVQLILTKIVCLAGLGCPVSLFFFDRASWAARYHYFFRAGPAGLPGIIIVFGPGRLDWPVSLFFRHREK